MSNTGRILKYEMLHNIRDLGGIRTRSAGKVESGRFIRCGHLSKMSDKDIHKLAKLVDTVVDFRSEGERAENPDIVIPGINYISIPIMDSLTAGITREKEADRKIFDKLLLKPDEAKKYMCDMYKYCALNEKALTGYRQFINVLLDEHEKGVLWHCTVGKDRAGIATAIVLEVLGVKREDIIEDYLLTNKYIKADIKFLADFVKKQAGTTSELADESLEYLLGANEDYINTFYKTIDETYGGFNGYLYEGLQLDKEDVIRLKEKSVKGEKSVVKYYDRDVYRPVIKSSICTGEKVAGFKNIHTGKIEEIMLIGNEDDLNRFKAMYGIKEEIAKEY